MPAFTHVISCLQVGFIVVEFRRDKKRFGYPRASELGLSHDSMECRGADVEVDRSLEILGFFHR